MSFFVANPPSTSEREQKQWGKKAQFFFLIITCFQQSTSKTGWDRHSKLSSLTKGTIYREEQSEQCIWLGKTIVSPTHNVDRGDQGKIKSKKTQSEKMYNTRPLQNKFRVDHDCLNEFPPNGTKLVVYLAYPSSRLCSAFKEDSCLIPPESVQSSWESWGVLTVWRKSSSFVTQFVCVTVQVSAA